MTCSAIWQRLDTPGHDAALLSEVRDGWSLRGTAVFEHSAGPACIIYSVDLDSSWRTTRGTISGFLGERSVDHRIERKVEGWYLDGALVDGLRHLVDLDFGFTPATNMQQLKRIGAYAGKAIDLPVVWFDCGEETLIELPQRYERRGKKTFLYAAPSVPYEGMLELCDNGFVRNYPGLWTIASKTA